MQGMSRMANLQTHPLFIQILNEGDYHGKETTVNRNITGRTREDATLDPLVLDGKDHAPLA